MNAARAGAGSAVHRILIIGDSRIAGAGATGQTLGKLAAELIGAQAVLDISGSSKTVADTLADAEMIRAFAPTAAVMCCGGVESLVDVGPLVARLIPQQITSTLKVAIKRAVVRVTGGQRRLPVDELRGSLRALLELLSEIDCHAMVVSTWEVDERLFPRTGAAMAETQEVLRDCAAASPGATLVNVWPVLDYWGDFQEDHLHLNEVGHLRVARLVARAIRAEVGAADRPGGAKTPAPQPAVIPLEELPSRLRARPADHPPDQA